jgi:hypothetical protein
MIVVTDGAEDDNSRVRKMRRPLRSPKKVVAQRIRKDMHLSSYQEKTRQWKVRVYLLVLLLIHFSIRIQNAKSPASGCDDYPERCNMNVAMKFFETETYLDADKICDLWLIMLSVCYTKHAKLFSCNVCPLSVECSFITSTLAKKIGNDASLRGA